RLAALAEEAGADIEAMEVIPDDRELIEDRLHHYVDDDFSLVFTTGGTGFSPDDVTPEATRDVLERDAPGFGEAMRGASAEHTPMWMTSRGVAGTRGSTLIVNFPGNPPAIEQAGAAIERAIPHTLALLGGGGHH
ncbi:MAG: molybdenum cofactor biosynthesis protein B, partial [Vicinamibacteria bacterium]